MVKMPVKMSSGCTSELNRFEQREALYLFELGYVQLLRKPSDQCI